MFSLVHMRVKLFGDAISSRRPRDFGGGEDRKEEILYTHTRLAQKESGWNRKAIGHKKGGRSKKTPKLE